MFVWAVPTRVQFLLSTKLAAAKSTVDSGNEMTSLGVCVGKSQLKLIQKQPNTFTYVGVCVHENVWLKEHADISSLKKKTKKKLG